MDASARTENSILEKIGSSAKDDAHSFSSLMIIHCNMFDVISTSIGIDYHVM